MLRGVARYAMAWMIVYSCAITMTLTPDEFDRHGSKGRGNILVEIGKGCNLLTDYSQWILAHPKTRPAVKFKRPKCMVWSYQNCRGKHRQSAIMMATFIVAVAATELA